MVSPRDAPSKAATKTVIETVFTSKLFAYGSLEKDKNDEATQKSFASRFFPSGFGRELRLVFALAWPTVFVCLSINIVAPVTLMFCGHLGREQLDAVALANSVVNVCGMSLFTGMCTACDTLFSQAYGGKTKHLVGVYLQRSIFISLISCFGSWSIYANAEGLLLLLGQDPTVARIAGDYALFSMPGLIFYVLYQVFVKYLQNQNRVFPPVFIGIIGNGFNIIGHYIALYVLEYGTRSSAIVQAMTYCLMSVLTILYVIASGLYQDTWGGWSWRALQNWREFLKIAMYGLLMAAVEWWTFEVGVFASGILGQVELGALTVAFQLQSLCYVVPWGVSVACSIRVGQSLGAGNAEGAKTAAFVSQVLAGVFFLLAGTILLSVMNVIPLLFTNDKEVKELATEGIPVIVLILGLNSITATSAGTLRGTGRQHIGALCNAVGYALISTPTAMALMFATGLSSTGFWLGLATGMAPISVAYLVIIGRTDWNRQVIKAQSVASDSAGRKPVPIDTTPLLSDIENTGVCYRDPPSTDGSSPADMKLSSQCPHITPSQKCKLVIKCSLATTLMFSVFIVGLCVRLFVPLPSGAYSSGHFGTNGNGTQLMTNLNLTLT